MASDYLPFVAKRNRGAWVTVSAFGMDGPKGDVYGSELTVAAASSVLGIVRDPESGRLVKLPGRRPCCPPVPRRRWPPCTPSAN